MKTKRLFILGMAAMLTVGTAFCRDSIRVQADNVVIQEDVPNLKDAITEALGDDFIVGGAICNNEIADVNTMALVTKHCNAVTFGNELKPDCMFNYSNNVCPGLEEAELNGEKMMVPVTNFSRAEYMLDYFYDWNANNPDNQIKIRGHVLTWHSQTPEWFFHEDYDASKPYVTPEEMTKRHEWYIKTVLEHFVGEDSKYKDMFYGWDVVNEAVSDGTGTYRTDKENSSWWAVYQSQEYIINAFRFANKYAPETLELYYNDYGDSSPTKSNGIVQLLTDVKNAEGTRITGMGMQGHYQNSDSDPSIEQFMNAARAYAAVVDKVQLTELDFTASSAYDGTEATYDEEDIKLSYRYKDFYDAIKQLRAEGVNFTGLTVWGVIDKNSWLQTFNSAGGGTDGKRRQMPLLFDDNYQVKLAYWAFVDTTKLHYAINEIDVIETLYPDEEDKCFESGAKYSFEKDAVNFSFIPVWSRDGIKVKVTVKDDKKEDSDSFTVYYAGETGIEAYTISRTEATQVSGGYEGIVTIPAGENGFSIAQEIRLDVSVTNGIQSEAFNDHALNQAISSEYYARGILRSYMVIPAGTVTVDGEMDDIWKTSPVTSLTINQNATVQANARFLWDEKNLYAYVVVKDPLLNAECADESFKDSVEICIDEKNQKSSLYQDDDKLYRVNYLNEISFSGKKCSEETVSSSVKLTEDGYIVEAAFAWTHLRPFHGKEIGIEILINDAGSDGVKLGTLSWSDKTGVAYQDTSVFGTARLSDESTVIYDDVEFADVPETNKTESVEKNQETMNFWQKIWHAISSWFSNLWKKIKAVFS